MSEKTKHRILLSAIAITTIPFFAIVNRPESWSLGASNIKSISLYLSAALGYIGVSFFVWQLILGTRAISGLFFEDLVSKLRLHRRLGTYGVVFVFLHPLLIMYSYGENLLYTFTPDLSSTFETAVTYGRIGIILLLIVWVTSAIAKSKISYRPWKYIHYLSYPLLLVSLLHVPEIGSSFESQMIQAFWYSFVGISILCVALRLRMLFGFGKVSYEIVDRRDVTPEIVLLRLRYQQKNLEIRTGQYIYLQQTLFGEEHPFTVLDHNVQRGELLIAFKKFGKFTDKLATISIGDTLLVDGPYGVFTKERFVQPTRPAVYIAGGIGITPFVKHCLDNPPHQQFMFYANQTRQTAVFRESLQHHLGSRFVDIFSREQKINDEKNIEYGYFNADLLGKYISQPDQYDYFICGPKGMMDGAKHALASLSVPADQVHAEEFGF